MSEIASILAKQIAGAFDRFLDAAEAGAPDAFTGSTGMMFAGTRFYRAYRWECEERHRWEGRDWRRLKRERRKYMKAAAHR